MATLPRRAVNGDFVEQLRDAGSPDGAPIYFLCRSGRALEWPPPRRRPRAGLGPAYNVLEGFEGPHDDEGHRAVSGLEERRAARGGRDERCDPQDGAHPPRHGRRARRPGPQQLRRDGRGALPHLGLRLRECRAGRGGVQGRGRALHLQPLRQPHRDDVRGAAAPARGRRGVLRHGVRACPRCSSRWPRCCGEGDRVVSSRGLFGSCFVILDEILPRWGVETVFVDGPDLDQWREALSVPTAGGVLRDAEQPDAGARRHARRSASWPTRPARQVVVDNVFGTPVFSKPLEHGADVVVYSATKHIDGQGRALGGAVLGTLRVRRRAGEEPDAAHRSVDVAVQRLGAVKGLETLSTCGCARGRPTPRRRPQALEESHPRVDAQVRLPVAPVAPAARARPSPDARRRHGRDVRARRAARPRRSP